VLRTWRRNFLFLRDQEKWNSPDGSVLRFSSASAVGSGLQSFRRTRSHPPGDFSIAEKEPRRVNLRGFLIVGALACQHRDNPASIRPLLNKGDGWLMDGSLGSTDVRLQWPFQFPARTAMDVGTAPESPP